ncbi:MAG: PaaX [Halioglobus sp.]
MTQTTPKRLILSLLSAPSLEEAEISELILWGQLFDIDAATIRVSVGRLTRQGLLSSPSRGVYRIGPKGDVLSAAARDWIHAEDRVRPWQGDWLLAHTSHLGRSNRTGLRNTERAFHLRGFAECVSGLWCRPDNLAQRLSATRTGLLQLGLDESAVLVQATKIQGISEKKLFDLWPGKVLEKSYKRHSATMKKSLRVLAQMDLAAAARQSIQIGEAVIRQINADPLLPMEMIDTRARQQMISQMIDYDTVGIEIWQKFTRSHGRGTLTSM